MSTNRYDTCCEILNKNIQNYFENIRGLEDKSEDSRTQFERSYIFTFKEIRATLDGHKSPGILKKDIPVFNRNRLRYLLKDGKKLDKPYQSDPIKHDLFVLEHIGEMFKALEFEYVLFSWNLGCLGIKNKDSKLNNCELYFYDMIGEEWMCCSDELYNKVLKDEK